MASSKLTGSVANTGEARQALPFKGANMVGYLS